jgi:hypothetical protein
MRSATGHGGHERNCLARQEHGVEAVKESDVFVGDKYVHEPAQSSAVIEDAKSDARIGRVHGHDGLANRFGLDRYFADATDESAQLAGETNGHAHDVATNW